MRSMCPAVSWSFVLGGDRQPANRVEVAFLYHPLGPRDLLERVSEVRGAPLDGVLERPPVGPQLILGGLELEQPLEPKA